MEFSPSRIKLISGGIGGGMAALILLCGTLYQIDQSERGVILRNGRATGVATPGLNVKIPFIDSVVKLSVQSQMIRYEAMDSYSMDKQPSKVRLSVKFHSTRQRSRKSITAITIWKPWLPA